MCVSTALSSALAQFFLLCCSELELGVLQLCFPFVELGCGGRAVSLGVCSELHSAGQFTAHSFTATEASDQVQKLTSVKGNAEKY